MDGWAETYYRNERDYTNGKNKVLPYAVNCQEKERIGLLTKRLKAEGYTYAASLTDISNQITTFLVNTEFKKYAKIPFPAKYACVNDRVYSIEEFIEEVLKK